MSYLSSCSLAHKASSLLLCSAIGAKTEALDMSVCEGTIVAGVALDLTDLDHGVVRLG